MKAFKCHKKLKIFARVYKKFGNTVIKCLVEFGKEVAKCNEYDKCFTQFSDKFGKML